MSSFNSTADLLLDHLSTMADGKTQICMVDEFARAALDVICKVSNTDTTETAEKFDFSSKKTSLSPAPLDCQQSFLQGSEEATFVQAAKSRRVGSALPGGNFYNLQSER